MEQFTNKVIQGDCLEVMKDIPDKSVDCIVTSPPYYNQLSYESNSNSYLQYIEFITKVAKESFRVLKNNSYFFLNFANDKTNTIKPYEVLFRFLEQGFTLDDMIIWYRDNSQPVNTDRQLTPQYEFILKTTKGNDIVLDMFMGSGTTAYACKKNNRNHIGIEISPEYIDIINKRLTQDTNPKE